MEGTASADTNEALAGSFTFKTHDAVDKVIGFYKDAFTSAGLKESANLSTAAMSMVAGEDTDKNRTASVMVSPDAGQNSVRVTFKEKR